MNIKLNVVISAVCIIIIFPGCRNTVKPEKADSFKTPLSAVGIQDKPAIPNFFTGIPPEEGALWSESSKSLFSDSQARRPGDLVIVDIVENATSTMNAKTSTSKTTGLNAGISNLMGLGKGIQAKNANLDLASLITANYENKLEGEG